MLKGLFKKGLLKDAGNALEVLKDNKGRFSSKRTVAGVIAGVGVTILTTSEKIETTELIAGIICFAIAALIVVLAPVTEKQTKDEYKGSGSEEIKIQVLGDDQPTPQ